MKLIELYEKEIRLNSHLTEYAFGKTNYNSILAEEGVFWNGESFESWNFHEVQSFNVDGSDERFVFYCAENPFAKNAKTLQEYFLQDDKEAFLAAKTVCQVITLATKSDHFLPALGPGGIIIGKKRLKGSKKNAKKEDVNSKKEDEDSFCVLFLPEKLFFSAANGLSKEEQFFAKNSILNESLHGLPALCFMRSSIAYRSLTKNFAFRENDLVARSADILDRNFMPIEFCIEGISPTLALAVDKGLKLTSTEIKLPGKKKKGKASEDLFPEKDFPCQLMNEAWELQKNQKTKENDDFTQRANKYMKAHNAAILTKRKIRRNSFSIIASAIVFLVFVLITVSTINTRMGDYTSKGLSSTETIRAFFYAVNTKSTTLINNVSKGKKVRSYSDTISQIFVLSKQRQAYSHDNGFATPENWLIYSTDYEKYLKCGIYGITQLTLDGEKTVLELDVQMKTVKDKPQSIKEENGIIVENGSVSVHSMQYYLIRSESDEIFEVESIKGNITLTFVKDRWLVTDIETVSSPIQVDCKKFWEDYFAALKNNDGKQIEAVKSLREKYVWLPTEYAMQKETERLLWVAEHPMDALAF